MKGLEYEEQNAIIDITNLENRKNALEQALSDTLKQHFQQVKDMHTYKHMIERMEKDKIFLSLKIQKLENNLQYKSRLLESEEAQRRKTGERKLKAQKGLDTLIVKVSSDQKRRQRSIREVSDEINMSEEMSQKRQDTLKRRKEIAEAAAADNSDKNEQNMRSIYYANKIWNIVLKKKMEEIMKNSQIYEKAFLQIKEKTGIEDVQEIINLFVTRKNKFSNKQINALKNDKRKNILIEENNELKNILKEKYESKDSNITNSSPSLENVNLRNVNNQTEFERKKIVLQKDNDFFQGQIKITKKVQGELKEWINKIKENLELQLKKINENNLLIKLNQISSENIEQSFNIICDISKELSKSFIDHSVPYISLKPHLNNFATDIFTNKINRIKKKLPKLTARKEKSVTIGGNYKNIYGMAEEYSEDGYLNQELLTKN